MHRCKHTYNISIHTCLLYVHTYMDAYIYMRLKNITSECKEKTREGEERGALSRIRAEEEGNVGREGGMGGKDRWERLGCDV